MGGGAVSVVDLRPRIDAPGGARGRARGSRPRLDAARVVAAWRRPVAARRRPVAVARGSRAGPRPRPDPPRL